MSKHAMEITSVFGLLSVILIVPTAAAQNVQSGHPQHTSGVHAEQGPHGGQLQTVGAYQVETLIQAKGVMFTVFDQQGKTITDPKATGSLELRVGDKPKAYDYKLVPLRNGALGVAVDLSKVAGHPLHMNVQLQGLAAQPLEFHAMGRLSSGLSDHLLISLQKTCPVTGKPLGSMGAPPKIMLGDKPLFVCCAGCTAKVEAAPASYLKKYYETLGREVRPGVFEATLADAKAIAAQQKCPVMDEELGGMGPPQKVNVKNKAVYICCAGCAKKLAAEPDKYLATLAQAGVTPPDFK